MNSFRGSLFRAYRSLHMISSDGRPSEYLKKRIAEIDKRRKLKIDRKHKIFVKVPGSREWLDTPTLPMIFSCLACGLATKLYLMYKDSISQEEIERREREEDPEVGTVRMLTREEWDEMEGVGPQSPYESQYIRRNSRIRTGEKLSWEDYKDWSIDMLTDGLTRTEETVKRGSNQPGSGS